MNKLKPCPICGHEPEIEPWHGAGLNSTRIGCNADFCPVGVGVVCPSRRGAIKAWNTRPIEDALRAEVAELKAEIDRLRAVASAATSLFDNRLGWSDGRSPYAAPEFWDDLGAAIRAASADG